MVNYIILNHTKINIHRYQEDIVNGLYKVFIEFKVTSEDYHDISVLLYEGQFDVQIPEKEIKFKGAINHYSTSITNLYEENQVGDYKLELVEIKEEG